MDLEKCSIQVEIEEQLSLDHEPDVTFLSDAELIDFPIEGTLTPLCDDHMHRKLAYYFMNPVEKWHAKHHFPWKLCLQIIKIIFVTVQLTLFGLRSHKYVQQHQAMTAALGHIFLDEWTVDVATNPPDTNSYAVFTIPEFYKSLDHIVKQYSKISTTAIASYSYDSPTDSLTPLSFCIQSYEDGWIFPFNSTVVVLSSIKTKCIEIPVFYTKNDPHWNFFSMESFLNNSNFTLNFMTLIKASLSFQLKTIFLKSLSKLDVPECYVLNITIIYDNKEHDGEVSVSLDIYSIKLSCHVSAKYESISENKIYMFHQLLNSSVIVLSILSAVLCLRSLFNGQMLRREASRFFSLYFGKIMPFTEHLDFIDFWYVMIFVSDILITSGSIIKIQIEEHNQSATNYKECSILLGIGNLLVWVGLLRYLGFFPKYNMLILTLKHSLPNVLRFVLCVIFLFAGFCFCGWIVLGPYHVKFQSLSSTSECLFAVMNGDDMFATFALINTHDYLIWWFSRIYLYLFLVLFVYVVISLFISVIMDTFETIKNIYIHGSPPKSTVEIFLSYKIPTPLYDIIDTHENKNKNYNSFTTFKLLLFKLMRCFNKKAVHL